METPHTSGIYKIENIVNGKCYIGQTYDLCRRIKTHLHELRNGLHPNRHLQRAWDKYGEAAFQISVVEECKKADLDSLEVFYIKKFSAYENGYNMGIGGDSNRGWHHSEDAKARMSMNHYDCSGANNPMYGVSLSDILTEDKIADWRSHISESISGINNPFYGRSHTSDAKAAISKANKGRLAGDKHPRYGKTIPDDVRQKIRTSHANYIANKNHSEMPNAKRIVCLNTFEEFGSIIEASQKYGILQSSISSCCAGAYRSAGVINGEHAVFVFLDDYQKMSDKEVAEKILIAQSPNKGVNNKRSKPVICLTTGKVYETCRDAGVELDLDYSSISKACRGIIKSCGKSPNGEHLKWMFYCDYLSHANHESEA